jgi:hypothetical protein
LMFRLNWDPPIQSIMSFWIFKRPTVTCCDSLGMNHSCQGTP